MTVEQGLAIIRERYPHWKPTSKYNPNGQILRFANRMLEKSPEKKELPELYLEQLNLFKMERIERKPSRAYIESVIMDDYYLYLYRGEKL